MLTQSGDFLGGAPSMASCPFGGQNPPPPLSNRVDGLQDLGKRSGETTTYFGNVEGTPIPLTSSHIHQTPQLRSRSFGHGSSPDVVLQKAAYTASTAHQELVLSADQVSVLSKDRIRQLVKNDFKPFKNNNCLFAAKSFNSLC